MSRKLGLTALLLALALVAAACGDDDGTSTTTAAGSTTTGGSLTGSIDISGSSTVEPISAGVAELFGALNPDVAIKVEGPLHLPAAPLEGVLRSLILDHERHGQGRPNRTGPHQLEQSERRSPLGPEARHEDVGIQHQSPRHMVLWMILNGRATRQRAGATGHLAL